MFEHIIQQLASSLSIRYDVHCVRIRRAFKLQMVTSKQEEIAIFPWYGRCNPYDHKNVIS